MQITISYAIFAGIIMIFLGIGSIVIIGGLIATIWKWKTFIAIFKGNFEQISQIATTNAGKRFVIAVISFIGFFIMSPWLFPYTSFSKNINVPDKWLIILGTTFISLGTLGSYQFIRALTKSIVSLLEKLSGKKVQ